MDVLCGELAIGYEAYLQEKSHAEANGLPAPVKYSEQELKAMVDAVKKGRADASRAKADKK